MTMSIDLDTVLWKSLLLPILAAIITTLAIELLAKPGIEARKTRLIRDREQFDKIVFDFQHVSASIAAIPDYQLLKENPILKRHCEIMLDEAKVGLYDLLKDVSRLSTRFVASHSSHVAKTSRYIGYLLAQIELIQESGKKMGWPSEKTIRKLQLDAAKMELFDVYYMAYPYLVDSQEDWWRRWYWRLVKKRVNDKGIDSYFKSIGIAK